MSQDENFLRSWLTQTLILSQNSNPWSSGMGGRTHGSYHRKETRKLIVACGIVWPARLKCCSFLPFLTAPSPATPCLTLAWSASPFFHRRMTDKSEPRLRYALKPMPHFWAWARDGSRSLPLPPLSLSLNNKGIIELLRRTDPGTSFTVKRTVVIWRYAATPQCLHNNLPANPHSLCQNSC